MEYIESIASSLERIAEFLDSIHLTEKGRIGTNDYATWNNNKVVAVLMKGVLVELQKLNAQKQKVFA